MKDNPNYPLAHLVGEVIPASMQDRVPLQAADVYCWHESKFRENGLTDPGAISSAEAVPAQMGKGPVV
jgi:hypothetical protein